MAKRVPGDRETLSKSKVGRPSRTSRSEILNEAAALLRDDGFRGFSMRALATRLGAAPTAIYTFFEGKDGLLQALAETELAGLWVDCDVALDWEEALRTWMHGLREALLEAKWLEDLIALTCHSPVVLSGVERVAIVLKGAGLSRARSVLTAQNLLWTVLGFVLMEIEAGQPGLADLSHQALRTPGFRRLTKHLAIGDFGPLYEITVENAVAGVASQLA